MHLTTKYHIAYTKMKIMLTDLKRKEKAKIIELNGGRRFQMNMGTMGVRTGKVLEMVTGQPGGGPVVIKIDNLTITIGRCMAMKVMVERI